MRTRFWVGILFVVFGSGILAARGSAPSASTKRVIAIEIRGGINPATADYLEAALQAAKAEDAPVLVLSLDTPGGLVSSVRRMAQAIETSPVPVVVFVHPAGASATSAGALLLLASHVAVMAPGAAMGAAHPVGAGGEEIAGEVGKKATQDVAAFARGLAEVRGRDPKLAEAIVTQSRSFTAAEAEKQGLVDLIAADETELYRKLQGRRVRWTDGTDREIQLPANVQTVLHPMSWGQSVLSTLAHPNIATLLFSLGGLLLYVEFQTPGVGLAGGLGIVSLLAGLTAYQLLPIRTSGLLLLVLGLALFIAEIFITSHGALAASGLVAFVLGVLWVIDPSATSLRISAAVWMPLVATMAISAALIAAATARLQRRVQETLRRVGGGGLAGLAGYTGIVDQINHGDPGRRGKLRVRGELWDFECDEELRPGQPVTVISVDGLIAKVVPGKALGSHDS